MKKLMNKKGFTLMEMLIVIAIIVILVAIAVPTFSANLDDAKAATDAANERSAKAVAIVQDMDSPLTVDTPYYFDVTDGKLVTDKAKLTDKEDKGQSSGKTSQVIKVVKSSTGEFTVSWE